MQQNTAPQLQIYNASAGSGKTYTLAQEYIDILIRNPQNYKSILAVTFTNKATAEMKERIVNNLASISSGNSKLLNAQLAMAQRCNPRISAEEVRERCRKALLYILNDYGQFNVSTIDSFVQKVVRAFAYEFRLNADFGVELDVDSQMKMSLDELMKSVSNDKDLLSWLNKFVKSKVDEDSSWNIDNDIISLGKAYFEKNPDFERKIDLTIVSELRKEIDKIRKDFEAVVGDFVEKYQSLCGGLSSTDYKDGQRNPLFSLLQKKRREAIDYLLNTKTLYIQRIVGAAHGDKEVKSFKDGWPSDEVQQLFVDTANYIEDNITSYYTADCAKKNLYALGIMERLMKFMSQISKENHTVLLNNSNTLLHRLIDGCDVPFVYEKIGTRYNNIMIDEFQDTSTIQWENFKPLIDESLSKSQKCLVVGDVKQAIYRWRNSDWNLLSSVLPQLYAVEPTPKRDNWRSMPNIVNFNNVMFGELCRRFSHEVGQIVDKESDAEIDNIYKDCSQTAQRKGNGYVQVNVLPKKGKEEVDPRPELLVSKIQELHDNRGFCYSDMCVLIRNKKDSEKFIGSLLEAGIPIITNDSLKICHAPIVRIIISYLNYFVDRSDLPSMAYIVKNKQSDKAIEDFASDESRIQAKTMVDAEVAEFVGLSLLEIVNSIVSSIPEEVIDKQQMFLQAFMEVVRDFVSHKRVNISDFLEYYEDKKESLTVELPQNQDAVTVMTVHKSKGLEYKVVLMPYADWNFTNQKGGGSTLWVNIAEAPFNKIELLPLTMSKTLAYTYAKNQYQDEVRNICIDNLNLAYVALTRACNVLIIWAEDKEGKDKKNKDKKKESSLENDNLGRFIVNAMSSVSNALKMHCSNDEQSGGVTYELGELEPPVHNVESQAEYPMKAFVPKRLADMHDLKFSLESEKENFAKSHKVLAYGNAMHFIMRYIHSTDDVEKSVQRAALNGFIEENQVDELIEEIGQKLTDGEVAKWFDGTFGQVFTESTILTDCATPHTRPDRFMIDVNNRVTIVDYKFGGEQKQIYRDQVHSYVNLLKKAGYDDVCGYLWYYELNVVEKVV